MVLLELRLRRLVTNGFSIVLVLAVGLFMFERAGTDDGRWEDRARWWDLFDCHISRWHFH